MADEVIKGAKIEIGLDAAGLKTEGVKVQATVKGINQALNTISGATADRKLQEVQKAVERLGGVASLSAPQVARLRGELEKLSSAGAKIPKSLTLPKLDTAKFGLGGATGDALKGIQAQAQGLAGALGPVGAGLAALGPGGIAAAAGIGAAVLAAKQFADLADGIADLATRTGLSIEATQRFSFAYQSLGSNVENLTKDLDGFQKSLAAGDPAFKRLGLDVTALKAMALDDALKLTLKTIISTGSITEQNALAFELFGKGGFEAAQLARQGVLELAESAQVFSDQQIRDGDALKQSLIDLDREWAKLKGEFGADAAPALTELTKGFQDILRLIKDIDAALPDFLKNPGKAFGGKPIEGGKSFLGIGVAKDSFLDRFLGSSAAAAKTAAPAPVPVSVAPPNKPLGADPAAVAKAAAEAAKHAREVDAARSATLAREDAIADGIAFGNKHLAEQADLSTRVTESTFKQLPLAEAKAKFSAAEIGLQNANVDLLRQQVTLWATMNGFSLEFVDALLGTTDVVEDVKESTFDWGQQLQNLANLAQTLPGIFGKTLGAFVGGLLNAKAAADEVKKSLTAAGGFGKLSNSDKFGVGASGLSVIGGIRAQAGGVKGAVGGAAAGAAFGSAFGPIGTGIGAVAGGLLGLFKSDPVKKAQKQIAKSLGEGISKEFAQQALELSKSLGISLEAAAKQLKTDALKDKFSDLQGKASSAIGQIGAGLGAFGQVSGAAEAQGRIFSAQFFAVVKAQGLKAAKELFNEAFGKLPEEVKAAIPGEIKQLFSAAKNDAFASAVDAGSAFAEGFRGTVGLIGFSKELAADFGAVAAATKDQAKGGALEAGLSEAEAEKASLQAIVPLLSEMKSAALASGQALDANSQALIAQAEAAGISIPIDPLVQVADLLRQMLDLQRELAGLPPLAPKVDTTQLAQAPAAAATAGEETGKAFQEGVVKGVEGTATRLEDADVFGGLKDAAEMAADGATGALDEIAKKLAEIGNTVVSPEVKIDVTGGGSGPSGPEFATGGVGRFSSRGTLAKLHGLEAVVPLGSGKRAAGLRVLGQMQRAAPDLMREFISAAVASAPPLRVPAFANGGINFSGGGASSPGAGGSLGGGITIAAGAFAPVINIDGSGLDPQQLGDACADALRQEHVRFVDELERVVVRAR